MDDQGGPAITFSLDGLTAVLGEFVAAGFTAVGFGEADPAAPHLVLRHDVDFDLRAALRVAEAEAAIDVRSTFFVMVRSECYSVLEPTAQADLRAIVGLGHRVGLHLDATLYAEGEIHLGAERELDILSWVSGTEPDAISFHRPLPHLVGSGDHGFALPHTYEPRFTNDITYVSDSQGRFRFGSPFATEAFAERRAVHLLLHPIWWAGDVASGTEARLRGMVEDRHHAFAARVARNCLPYAAMIS